MPLWIESFSIFAIEVVVICRLWKALFWWRSSFRCVLIPIWWLAAQPGSALASQALYLKKERFTAVAQGHLVRISSYLPAAGHKQACARIKIDGKPNKDGPRPGIVFVLKLSIFHFTMQLKLFGWRCYVQRVYRPRNDLCNCLSSSGSHSTGICHNHLVAEAEASFEESAGMAYWLFTTSLWRACNNYR